MKQKGFAPLIILILIGTVGVAAYFGYKNNIKKTSPESTPGCRVNCPTPFTPKTGSIPGWSLYEGPDGKFSFEYPKTWYYVPFDPKSNKGGIYSVTKEELDEISARSGRTLFDFFYAPLEYHDQKLSDRIDTTYLGKDPLQYKIASKTFRYFGKTKVTDFKFCNGVEFFVKGRVAAPGTVCESHSYIDMGDNGYIEVSATDIAKGFAKEEAIYNKILSTFKFTN